MEESEVEVLIPPHLEEMVDKMFAAIPTPKNGGNERKLAYERGWIGEASRRYYRDLVRREGIPSDPLVVKLLCELALMRGLVEMHEVKSEPTPIPSIKDL